MKDTNVSQNAIPEKSTQSTLLNKLAEFAAAYPIPTPDFSTPANILLCDLPTGRKNLSVAVYVDTIHYAYQTILHTQDGISYTIRKVSFIQPQGLIDFLTSRLELVDLITPTKQEWLKFEFSKPGHRWIAEALPIGTEVRIITLTVGKTRSLSKYGSVIALNGNTVTLLMEDGFICELHPGADHYRIRESEGPSPAEKYEEAAERFCAAIKKLGNDPEKLNSMECYLSCHFQTWLNSYARNPEDFAAEMICWADN